jgi:hypothetical protein
MKFVFSNHAIEQMKLRNISQTIVEKILKNPQQIIKENGHKIYQSIVKMGSGNYLIRVFIIQKDKINLIKTVYRTSKINKYNEGKI